MTEITNPQHSPSIPFEVNGEVIYLSPNSAEGKALQRIEAMEAGEEVEWITVFDPDKSVIEVAEVDAWLEELNRTGWVTSEESVALSLDEIYRKQKVRRGSLTKEQLRLE
jgi:hypothetical protein